MMEREIWVVWLVNRKTAQPSGHTLTVKAKVVIVAAGGYSSAPLLMRSGVRDASGGGGSAQTEQTIAVDPTDPNQVLIGFISGLSVSHDGGRTWTSA